MSASSKRGIANLSNDTVVVGAVSSVTVRRGDTQLGHQLVHLL